MSRFSKVHVTFIPPPGEDSLLSVDIFSENLKFLPLQNLETPLDVFGNQFQKLIHLGSADLGVIATLAMNRGLRHHLRY